MKLRTQIALLATIASASLVAAPAFATEANAVEAAVPAAAAPSVDVKVGTMIYNAQGYRIAAVYRVASNGAPQVILDGKLVTVPVDSLSTANGKVTTSLTKSQLYRQK